jgi:hypothetical protein
MGFPSLNISHISKENFGENSMITNSLSPEYLIIPTVALILLILSLMP